MSAEQYARRVLEQDIQGVKRKHISEVIRENMRDVPPEDLAALPRLKCNLRDCIPLVWATEREFVPGILNPNSDLKKSISFSRDAFPFERFMQQ